MGGGKLIAALVGGGAAYYAWQKNKPTENPDEGYLEGIDLEDLISEDYDGIDLGDLPLRKEESDAGEE
jgi:hypothetical protein